MFKGGTRDYIVINKQGCASWSSKKMEKDFDFTRSLLKEAIKFILQNCFFSIGNITMILVIGIPWDMTQHHFLQTSFQPTMKITESRNNVSLEQSMFEKCIIPLGLLMTCYH